MFSLLQFEYLNGGLRILENAAEPDRLPADPVEHIPSTLAGYITRFLPENDRARPCQLRSPR
jgi:hypothetical protein